MDGLVRLKSVVIKSQLGKVATVAIPRNFLKENGIREGERAVIEVHGVAGQPELLLLRIVKSANGKKKKAA